MDIFRKVSDTIAGIIKRHKTVDPISKHDVLDLIDNNLITLRLVVSTYESHTALFKYIQTELLSPSKPDTENSVLRGLYNGYVQALGSGAARVESAAILRTVYAAAKFVLAEHEAMRNNFDLLFKDGTDDGAITLEQLKLSHAVIFGFINLSSLLADWFCFFIGQIDGRPGETLRVPLYREKVLRESGKTVANFVDDVLARGASVSIVGLVQSVRKVGDVAIYTDAATLDSYANINDYPGVMRFMGAFTSFQPILMLRELLGSFARDRYKRNLAMREWVQAKMIILQMDADKLDPASPEYQRQKQILQRYSDELSKLDAKIDRYENG
jgi:hypothetical protein